MDKRDKISIGLGIWATLLAILPPFFIWGFPAAIIGLLIRKNHKWSLWVNAIALLALIMLNAPIFPA